MHTAKKYVNEQFHTQQFSCWVHKQTRQWKIMGIHGDFVWFSTLHTSPLCAHIHHDFRSSINTIFLTVM